jgi:uncharacterized protein (TIGR03083 family)
VDVQLLDDLRNEQAVLDRLLADTSPTGWSRPTPADGWTVSDSVRHLIVSDRAAMASLELGRDPLDGPGPGTALGPGGGPELLPLWRATRDALRSALADHEERDRVPWGGRLMSVRSLATARLMECWAHGLDCFAALETAPEDTDRLAHVAWLGWKTLPYAFAVAGVDPPAPPQTLRLDLTLPSGRPWRIGPEGAASHLRGRAGDWCRLVTHRVRSEPPTPLVAVGELAQASLLVGQAFL